jgi:hypothetical protein
MANLPFTGLFIPKALIVDKNLNWPQRLLLRMIEALSQKTGECYSSDKYLAAALSGCFDVDSGEIVPTDKMEYHPRTVSNMITELVKSGYIERSGYGQTRRLKLSQKNEGEFHKKMKPVSQKREKPSQKYEQNNRENNRVNNTPLPPKTGERQPAIEIESLPVEEGQPRAETPTPNSGRPPSPRRATDFTERHLAALHRPDRHRRTVAALEGL